VAARIGLFLTIVILLVGLEWSIWGWFVSWGDSESFPVTAAVFAAVTLPVIWLAVLIATVIDKAMHLMAGTRRY
jgi:hypothetical protein